MNFIQQVFDVEYMTNFLGSFACFSMSKKSKEWMWTLLSRCTPDKHWKAAWTKDGLLMSMYVGEVDHKSKKHKIITNVFKPPTPTPLRTPMATPTPTPIPIPITSTQTQTLTPSISIPFHIQTFQPVLTHPIPYPLIPQRVPSYLPSSNVTFTSPTSVTSSLFTTLDTSTSSTASTASTQSTSYSVAALNELTVPELREICDQYNIRPGKKRKHDLITHMAQILNPSDSAVSQLNAIETQIDKTFYGTEPLQHSFYRTNFNGVDLHDRYWYKISYNYQIRNWHSAFFFCLLKL